MGSVSGETEKSREGNRQKPRLNEDMTRKPGTLHANNTKIILKSKKEKKQVTFVLNVGNFLTSLQQEIVLLKII